MMNNGIFDLIAQSGLVAKIVLLVLLGASVLCWTIIISKARFLKRVHKENAAFLNTFWNGKTIDEIVNKSDRYEVSPIANIFKGGVKELRKLSSAESSPTTGHEKVENIQRALVRAANAEVASMEKNVGWLATTASAAPFVGLFGTVWGIMNSFQSIGQTGAANLAVVAPGISEALITTATGIAAAIPAVIAYNQFGAQIRRVTVDMDCFSQDFVNIIQRSLVGSKKG